MNKISTEHKGSCDWLWKQPQFKEWSSSKSSRLLLVEGKPGSGKSTLTRFFHKGALEHHPPIKSAVVASFFYSYREGELQRSHRNMLRSILYDIIDEDETFFYHRGQTEYRKHQKLKADYPGEWEWDYNSLQQLLKSLATHRQTRHIYLIIDAVDESDDKDRRSILTLLSELCSVASPSTVKAFVASRPIGEHKLKNCTTLNSIRLQDETKEAISLYARSFLDDLEMTKVYREAMDYILDHAQGVFLWVKLVGEELLASQESGSSQGEVFELLRSLPTELEDYYKHMFIKIRKQKKQTRDTVRMFSFVLYCQRPLTICEVLHALSVVESTGQKFVPTNDYIEKHLPSERRIWFCGGNFLEITDQNGERISKLVNQT
jgi:ankyrin repeat domain-containing protein 50